MMPSMGNLGVYGAGRSKGASSASQQLNAMDVLVQNVHLQATMEAQGEIQAANIKLAKAEATAR